MKTVFATFLILGFFLNSHAQHGVSPHWENEVMLPRHFNMLSSKQRGVLYNNNVATSNGKIVILTYEINPTNSSLIYGFVLSSSIDGGNTWATKLFNTPIPSGSLKLAMTKQDTIFVLWTSGSTGTPAIYVSILDSALNIIKDSVRVASSQLHGNFKTHFTTDRYNRIHVMWHEGEPGTSQTSVCYYTRSLNGGYNWEPVQQLSNNTGKHSAYPHAEFDVAGDTLCIPWRDSVNNSISVRGRWDVSGCFSSNGGASWSTAQSLVSTTDADWDPDVLIDNQGRIHLFYHVYPFNFPVGKAQIKYKYSDNLGVTWHLPASLPVGQTNGQLSDPNVTSLLVEGTRFDIVNNVLWTAWKDQRDFVMGNDKADMMVAFSSDRGVSWAPSEFVTDRFDSTIGFKAAGLLPTGEYFVNYEVRSNHPPNDPNGFMRVYFRKRQLLTTGVQFETTSSINDNNFLIYPNPARDYAFIEVNTITDSENLQLEIFDSSGKMVKSLDMYDYRFEFKELQSGFYFIRVRSDNLPVLTKKFIILK